jgi:hypothetical protein
MRAAMQQPASHQARKLLMDGAKHKPSRHHTNNNRAGVPLHDRSVVARTSLVFVNSCGLVISTTPVFCRQLQPCVQYNPFFCKQLQPCDK